MHKCYAVTICSLHFEHRRKHCFYFHQLSKIFYIGQTSFSNKFYSNRHAKTGFDKRLNFYFFTSLRCLQSDLYELRRGKHDKVEPVCTSPPLLLWLNFVIGSCTAVSCVCGSSCCRLHCLLAEKVLKLTKCHRIQHNAGLSANFHSFPCKFP